MKVVSYQSYMVFFFVEKVIKVQLLPIQKTIQETKCLCRTDDSKLVTLSTVLEVCVGILVEYVPSALE